MEQNGRLLITFDNSQLKYIAGQTIQGNIWMKLLKRTKIRAIKVYLIGKGKCKWLEITRSESSNARSLFYSNKEINIHDSIPLDFFQPRGAELNPGEYNFDFSVPLPKTLPSSFKGKYGSIKYKLRIVIQKPWVFDEKHEFQVTVIKFSSLPPMRNIQMVTKRETKQFGIFGGKPMSMICILPDDTAVRNCKIKLLVTVTNNSNVHVEKLKFSIVQLITYFSSVPLITQRTEHRIIAEKEAGGVRKRSDRAFAHDITVPNTQPSDEEYSRVLTINYEMRVEAVMRGLYKNVVTTLPFKVFTGSQVLADIVQEQEITNIANGAAAVAASTAMTAAAMVPGNPFETPDNSAELSSTEISQSSVASPNDNSSIVSSNDSPAHLSRTYSETSSIETSSAVSDISEATLSPAYDNGGNATNSSASSSQYNSPAGRNSMRSSSTAPFSSPLMVNSYPPYTQSPPDSPEYRAMPMVCLPALQGLRDQRPMSWSANYAAAMRQPAPPGANDLPPSYESLFGGATAPPLSPTHK